jgi:hypothetical protein
MILPLVIASWIWQPNASEDHATGYVIRFESVPKNMVELVESVEIDAGSVTSYSLHQGVLSPGEWVVSLAAYNHTGLKGPQTFPPLVFSFTDGGQETAPPTPPLTFSFSGTGGSFAIEQSADLETWELFTGKWRLEIEVEPTEARQFFRVR